MKILVTGANGFIGKNLIAELNNRGYKNIFEVTRDTTINELVNYTREAQFVFHLAGINRPLLIEEYTNGNVGFTATLLNLLKEANNSCPVLFTSSIQAKLDNPYGISKKESEKELFFHAETLKSKVFIYRLPNVFGKWCRPNYNSAIATFCFNISNNLEIRVDDPSIELNLVYIDDVVQEFINALEGQPTIAEEYCEIHPVYKKTLGSIVDLIYSFKKSRETLFIPNMEDEFIKILYSTYLSYLPKDNFSYPLKMNLDDRGSFTEFLKTTERGQVSINISKPNITKGNHWHHTKNEKFLVVSGTGVIRLRKIDTNEIIEYFVSGERLEVIDIPVGYTHNIENLGETDMVTVMWVNEIYDPKRPDTNFLEV
ncbi:MULTISPECIES: NAD-dependent epimerase/dehydratase family protein [Lysinibacillus]|uniref:polysaccharide biosynthesis C-terminal domain-containing protein n=1 Tax=Lysinibacillus TaxID=400634 RepID=UPI00214BA87A|nr:MULTISPECIES: NAD-dependent epimerase/dehydratase family protein [Lysinibacillus]UUV25090.1 NAD-dependent epimerase/dehydratase family protein [Lysinibacillus sp. FN11]UYB47962.1 NAD-dependent epimerase/dehydratase family protein [Lysinibacillus capsici]